jgi:hypothetical protein
VVSSPSLVAPLFAGPLDIVGDIHGELDALRALLARLGYAPDGTHPNGRRLVFVGDLGDRGHDSPGVIELVRALVERDRAQCVLGNHELNLLRRDLKHGNAWYLDASHDEQQSEFRHCRPAPAEHTYDDFFRALPLALEREDLRVVHAAWDAAAIASLRTGPQSTVEAFEAGELAADEYAERSGLAALARTERAQHEAALKDKSRPCPLLRNLGKLDEIKQMMNPVRVLTSGPERLTSASFFANGKWRMCDRVKWWDEYTDETAVVVGHYWRIADLNDEDEEDDEDVEVSGGKPDLFAGFAHDEWVGARRNVYCVDFSIGGRYRELARGQTSFKTRLAAMRWPERTLTFADLGG